MGMSQVVLLVLFGFELVQIQPAVRNVREWILVMPFGGGSKGQKLPPQMTPDDWVAKAKSIRDVERGLAYLLVTEESVVIKRKVATALQIFGGRDSVDCLVSAVKNDHEMVQVAAMLALCNVYDQKVGDQEREKIVRCLGEATRDSDWATKSNACTLLGMLGDERGREYLEYVVAHDKDDSVVKEARTALDSLAKRKNK